MILTTGRLCLREFEDRDWERVIAYQSNPLYLRYYHWTKRSEADVQAFVQMFLDAQQERPRRTFQLAVTLRHSGLLIGNCGIRINNPSLREANIGYELDNEYWGNGYATEAARAILEFGFQELRLRRVWANTLAVNKGSARVLEKLGMRLECREIEKEFIKDRWYDSLTYAILDREWDIEGND
ncbi:MAG: GNAT family N-acetyltransferase [Candidatus Promineifilaceae bacterium]|nr:GNAT family N-acetyltransferase [Candidatus Promineifilaceae bacterium]